MNKTTSKEIAIKSDTDTLMPFRGNENKVPTLGEMIAACDLTAERHQDAIAFEKAPARQLLGVKVCSAYYLDYLTTSNCDLAINRSNPMVDTANEVIVNFEDDSENSVSRATA